MSNRDFNWQLSIDAMNIIEINAVDIKSLQAGLTTSPYIRRFTTNAPISIFKTDTKLGSYLYFLSYSFNSLHKIR